MAWFRDPYGSTTRAGPLATLVCIAALWSAQPAEADARSCGDSKRLYVVKDVKASVRLDCPRAVRSAEALAGKIRDRDLPGIYTVHRKRWGITWWCARAQRIPNDFGFEAVALRYRCHSITGYVDGERMHGQVRLRYVSGL